MFIIEPVKKEEAKGELKLLYKMIERMMGFMPPHFELFATIDIKAMKEFLEYNIYMMNHKNIDKDILPFLRLEIANRECRNYCINFNTQILEQKGVKDFKNPSLDNKQIILMQKVLKAIYESTIFGRNDIDELENIGFSNKDFFEILSYSTKFMANSKMIEVYIK